MEKVECARRIERVFKEEIAFGVFDGKGREFGARWAVERVEYFIPGPGFDGFGGWIAAPGVQWVGRPHAMRGGELYGACQAGKAFADEAAAVAGKDAYFADARKRAEKNKARVK